jgi:phosphoribosylanthranilate isomerase
MAKTKVKICGLQSVEVLESFIKFPIDYAGFVFAPSRRRIEPPKAAGIIKQLPASTESVGVFVNPTLEELDEVLNAAPLDVVQLHGSETPEFCARVKSRYSVQVWKVLAAKGEVDAESLLSPYVHVVDAFLLDTYDPQALGGTGVTFPWGRIPTYRQMSDRYGIPVFIAGGLNPDNIKDLIEQYKPFGVDVSSGVETEGIKDIEKIERFVERVGSYGDRAR